ncbi:tRNA threonylcarbamoyladenosine dehydratase [Riemerella columbipharyngis]|uniref:tRNA A37 threonylcarbamoyladenosine dehydratase n=1 Tax=Riemerella columbipharyngis TaxID=1071918 RepID=A0A1G7C312_9FLAO|nr:tRNA threonylcarbamoyladenosine dehydratase [Riemerella columbipharyngis]SDE33663.1 tRNA A37 threonylcarbamoyladenosine dehydratase [Riemerella columbipharyngis]
MTDWLERAELLVKKEGLEKLLNAKILVVGLGGVGSFAAEFLVRAGVGAMTIIDGDTVDITNINRQLPATWSSIGKDKVEVMKQRLLDINPSLKLTPINEFLNPDRMADIIALEKFDYILDCIDSLSPKISLIKTAKRNKAKIISAMGAGGKTDPKQVTVADISKTRNCFLAKHIRKRLRKDGINKGFKCVFSTEIQKEDSLKMTDGTHYKRSFYGTISYMPALFGLYAAAEVVNYIVNKKKE